MHATVSRTLTYHEWLKYKISTLRPTYRGTPASEKRREQWRRYGQSAKGAARYSKYNATPRGVARVDKYRRSVHGMMTLARARLRKQIAESQARLEELGAAGMSIDEILAAAVAEARAD